MRFEFFGKKKETPQTQQEELAIEVKKQDRLTNENFKPIRACLIDSTKNLDSLTKETIERIEKEGQFVNYDGDHSFLKENNLKNAGMKTYVISESNEKDKYSKRYCNCTGIIVVGEKKESKKQISLLSHQDPEAFLYYKKTDFTSDLIEAIREIKDKVKENSIDVIVFGGKNENSDEYEESIEYIGGVLNKEFGFNPTIMTGPNTNIDEDSTKVYLDTQNRRLYILRPAQKSEVNEGYLPNELEKRKKEWKRR